LPFISWLDPRNEAKKVKPYAAQPAMLRPRLLASQTQPCGFKQGLPLRDSRDFAIGCSAMASYHAAKKDFVSFDVFAFNNPINASDTKDVLFYRTRKGLALHFLA